MTTSAPGPPSPRPPMGPDPPAWVGDPALGWFWTRVADRLEANGLAARGRLAVTAASRAERHALGALLGRAVTRERVTVDLAVLDARLADRSPYAGLAAAAAAVTGRSLRDRPGERADAASRREEPLRVAASLVEWPWVGEWTAGLRRSGLLTGRADAVAAVTDAATVLRELVTVAPAGEPPPVPGGEPAGRGESRVGLAARLLGDAHALDEDRLVTHLVLRGLAAAGSEPVPATPGERRALWQRYDVAGDRVSTTCLVLGLRPRSGDRVSRRLLDAAAHGDPLHLTAWDLSVWAPRAVEPRTVLVCENPRVLEAVAEESGDGPDGAAVVCTSGEPSTVVAAVLDRLVAAGCRLRYHGDFDWPGIAIANRMVARHGVRPWLMSASDYERGLTPRGLPLAGTPVDPAWDPELGAAMRAHGTAVHEEAVLDRLLDSVFGDS